MGRKPSLPFPKLRTERACESAFRQPRSRYRPSLMRKRAEIADDFQAKLLRFRLVNRACVPSGSRYQFLFRRCERKSARGLRPFAIVRIYKIRDQFLPQQSRKQRKIGYPTIAAWLPKRHCSSVTGPIQAHFFVGELAEIVNHFAHRAP